MHLLATTAKKSVSFAVLRQFLQDVNELISFVDTGLPSIKYGLGVNRIKRGIAYRWSAMVLAGDAIGYASETSYLPDHGGATSVALTNREYRLEANPKSSTTPIRLARVNSILGETA